MQEILEDVHESLATPDNGAGGSPKSQQLQQQATHKSSRKVSYNRNVCNFDSIATLTEIMDHPSTTGGITIPGSSSCCRDPDNADTSSTKTEVEEMELDQFSDLEDNIRAHENVMLLLEIIVIF